jgi:alanine dehydrogenase
MKIGIPREIKAHENRVSLRPAGAETLVLGGGVVGYSAAKIAAGIGANVTILKSFRYS